MHIAKISISPFAFPSSQILKNFAAIPKKSQAFLLLRCLWRKASWFLKYKRKLQQCPDLSGIKYFLAYFTVQAQVSEYPCLPHLSWPAWNSTPTPFVINFSKALENKVSSTKCLIGVVSDSKDSCLTVNLYAAWRIHLSSLVYWQHLNIIFTLEVSSLALLAGSRERWWPSGWWILFVRGAILSMPRHATPAAGNTAHTPMERGHLTLMLHHCSSSFPYQLHHSADWSHTVVH